MSILNESLYSSASERDTAGEAMLAPESNRSYVRGATDVPLKYITIPEMMQNAVSRFGPRDAAIFPEQNTTLSYYDLQRETDNLAAGFLALGLKKGDRIGIWSPNRLEWVLTQYATARIGLILVNINPAYRLAELEFALKKVGCKALVLAECFKSSHYYEMIQKLVPEMAESEPGRINSENLPDLKIVIGMSENPGSGFFSFSEVRNLAGPAQFQRLDSISESLSPDDPINIQFTSGTTGAPKGATLSHFNILNNARFTTGTMNFSEQDVLCISVPMYHCFGMVMGSLGCVAYGATMVFPSEAFEPHSTLTSIENYRCTAVYGVPTMFVAMLEHMNTENFNLSTLRTGIMAGAPCPIEVMKRVISDMNLNEVTIAYGMTETSPVSFQSHVNDEIEKRVTTVGRVHPHVEVKIMAEDGLIAPIDSQGEIWTRGYSVMLGYWAEEKMTSEVVVDGGWMRTGDLGKLDSEGFCTIVGRVKDMIIRGGENIYPKEIEDFLFRHPSVQEAQVFGIPDEKFGEVVCAWIIPKAGADLSEDDIRNHCTGQIAHYKIPMHIRLVEEIPMTVTGKPQKFVMRDQMISMLQN